MLESLAQPLIREHHGHLVRAKILYLLSTQPMRDKDRVVLGKAQKNAPLLRYLSSAIGEEVPSVAGGYDFVLLFQSTEWGMLTPAQKIAAVDHELSHCFAKVEVSEKTGRERRSWTLLAHDLQEFTAVVARHGLWQPDVQNMARAVAVQLGLPETEVEDKIKHARMRAVGKVA